MLDDTAVRVLRQNPTYKPWIQMVIERCHLTDEQILSTLKEGLTMSIRSEGSLGASTEFEEDFEAHRKNVDILKGYLTTLENNGLTAYIESLSDVQ